MNPLRSFAQQSRRESELSRHPTGGKAPNDDAASVATTCLGIERSDRRAALIIDASHDNSGKKPEGQPKVLADTGAQASGGDRRIIGVMLKSNLLAGKQALVPGHPLVYGQSTTDGCIDWGTTEEVLEHLAEAVVARRALVEAA